MRAWIVGIVGLVAAGCSSSSSELAGKVVARQRPPLAPTFSNGGYLELRGASTGGSNESVTLALDGETWVLTGAGFDPGSTLASAGVSAVAGADGAIVLRVPAVATLGSVPLAALIKEQEPIPPGLSVTFEVPGAPAQTLPWPPLDARLGVIALLEASAKQGRPLVFGPGDVGGADRPPTTLLARRPLVVAGPGQTLADVDRLAIITRDAVVPKTCKNYKSATYGVIDIPISLRSVEVELHDRRTGARVGGGTMTATYTCPKTIVTDAIRPGETIPISGTIQRDWLSSH